MKSERDKKDITIETVKGVCIMVFLVYFAAFGLLWVLEKILFLF